MQLGFVYIWRDRSHKMFYVGCHLGTEDDGYVCSSVRMMNAYKKRPFDFKRRIIQRGIAKSDLFDAEHKWLRQMKKPELGKRYYNNKNHIWHWITFEETREAFIERMKVEEFRKEHGYKMGSSNSGRVRTEEFKKRVSDGLKKHKKSDDHLKKISAALKGKPPGNKGKPRSEETKRKMREAWVIRKQRSAA